MTQPEEPQLSAAEVAFTAAVFAALTAWLNEVRPAVMAPVARGGVPDPGQIWRFQTQWIARVDALIPDLQLLARRGWEWVQRQFGTPYPFAYDNLLLEQIQRTRNLLVRIPDEVYRQVVKSMAAGVDRGEDKAQIARRVDNILTVTGSENWHNRAQVISRTEVNRFFQAGQLASAQRIQEGRGIRIRKRWNDEDDSNVRRSHRNVDNQLRQLRQPFDIGTSMLQYPGDPAGAAGEVINCRCDLTFEEV
jgi:F like protein